MVFSQSLVKVDNLFPCLMLGFSNILVNSLAHVLNIETIYYSCVGLARIKFLTFPAPLNQDLTGDWDDCIFGLVE